MKETIERLEALYTKLSDLSDKYELALKKVMETSELRETKNIEIKRYEDKAFMEICSLKDESGKDLYSNAEKRKSAHADKLEKDSEYNKMKMEALEAYRINTIAQNDLDTITMEFKITQAKINILRIKSDLRGWN